MDVLFASGDARERESLSLAPPPPPPRVRGWRRMTFQTGLARIADEVIFGKEISKSVKCFFLKTQTFRVYNPSSV